MNLENMVILKEVHLFLLGLKEGTPVHTIQENTCITCPRPYEYIFLMPSQDKIKYSRDEISLERIEIFPEYDINPIGISYRFLNGVKQRSEFKEYDKVLLMKWADEPLDFKIHIGDDIDSNILKYTENKKVYDYGLNKINDTNIAEQIACSLVKSINADIQNR